MFDKKLYWQRRNNKFHVKNPEGEVVATVEKPLRGQIYQPVSKLVDINTGPNRKLRRHRIINRKYCKVGFENGVRINSKLYNIKKHYEKKQVAK